MSYLIEGIEIAALIALAGCICAYIWITVEDRIDFHYSKKRGEI